MFETLLKKLFNEGQAIMFKTLLKNLAHVAAIAAATTAATQMQSGPITSGNVLLPALGAAASAALGAFIKHSGE